MTPYSMTPLVNTFTPAHKLSSAGMQYALFGSNKPSVATKQQTQAQVYSIDEKPEHVHTLHHAGRAMYTA